MIPEDINLKIQAIENDLALLRDKHIHEIEKVPGTPKCSTLANRIQDNLDYIVNVFDEELKDQAESANREQFDLLFGMLVHLSSDIADLAKKQPDGLLNAFKVAQINRVLQPLKELLSDEPAAAFLDLVSEVEAGMEKSRNSYSDVAIILSQYGEACGEYRSKHYEADWDIRL